MNDVVLLLGPSLDRTYNVVCLSVCPVCQLIAALDLLRLQQIYSNCTRLLRRVVRESVFVLTIFTFVVKDLWEFITF